MELLDIGRARWSLAKKVHPLRAKPIVSLLVDRSVMGQVLVDTFEAREPVNPQAMFCIGESNDAWQQMPDKLLKHYDVRHIDDDGWIVCHSKPESVREFFEITPELLEKLSLWKHFASKDSAGTGFVQGLWGETVGDRPILQRFRLGDYVVRNREDVPDVWVVRRKIWLNTYAEINLA